MTNSHDATASTDAAHAGHPPFLAHHFDTPRQQFESGKLGMWIFLATEILMFGGLFCAYSVYRANHPEIFLYAHQFLDKILGGINTVILICSSLTMAWAVRCIQLNQRRATMLLLAMTILGGCGFMGIKYVEYKAKWEHGLLWGKYYAPIHHDAPVGSAGRAITPSEPEAQALSEPEAQARGSSEPEAQARDLQPTTIPNSQSPNKSAIRNPQSAIGTSAIRNPQSAIGTPATAPADDRSLIAPAAVGPPGLAPHMLHRADREPHTVDEPRNVQLFFSTYFLMTGLHGLHVLVGMGLIAWILVRTAKWQFSSAYFLPVDLVGLYWHLVDLIWIFLFPLLYLIG